MNIRSIKKEDLIKQFIDNNIEKYHAKQVFEWVHKSHILETDKMTNISKNLRTYLNTNYDFSNIQIEKVFKSNIDDTIKFLFKLKDNYLIESVLMTYSYGKTLCVSTQVGCKMGCKFCASTIGGFIRNLDINELVSQVYEVENYTKQKISNIVVMGIGEPLENVNNLLDFISIINDEDGDNISSRNVTISTCGIVPIIEQLANENNKFTLALSLHAPNDRIRNMLMPISKKYNIIDVLNAMSLYYFNTKRRITIEYALVDNINSDIRCANELCDLFYENFIKKHVDFNVNLIPVNEVKETKLARPNKVVINNFMEILKKHNISVTLRRELGKDISGSCGQLRRSYNEGKC